MALMEPGLTLDRYRGVLTALYPIVYTWETWAHEHAPAGLQELLTRRHRSYLLRDDLIALHHGPLGQEMPSQGPWPSAIVENGDVPWEQVVECKHDACDGPERQAAFLGVIYVLEGSTLGGRLIARHVEPTLGLTDGHGSSYFRGHGEATGALWRETVDAIAAVPDTDILNEAALRTFAVFRAALKRLDQ